MVSGKEKSYNAESVALKGDNGDMTRQEIEQMEFEQGLDELFEILLDKAKENKISYDDIEDNYFGPLMEKKDV